MSVKIRNKRGRLYLDIYQGVGKRTWEALHLTMTSDKVQNKEIMRFAEICRSKRETQILACSWNIQDQIAGKKQLVVFLDELAKARIHNDYITGCIRYLKAYNNGHAKSGQGQHFNKKSRGERKSIARTGNRLDFLEYR